MTTWSNEGLLTLLSSSAVEDERAVLQLLDRLGESLGCTALALTCGDRIVHSWGPIQRPDTRARIVRSARMGWTNIVDDHGTALVVYVALIDPVEMRFVVALREGPFELVESETLSVVCQLAGMNFRQQRSLDTEQSAREAIEALATQTSELVATLRKRQVLFDHLSAIERAISQRHETATVLDSITHGVSEILGDDVICVLRLIDAADARYTRLVSTFGLDQGERSAIFRVPVGHGVGAVAMEGRRLVALAATEAAEHGDDVTTRDPLTFRMATPVYRENELAGALVVGSRRRRTPFSIEDEGALRAFAEHVSIALNDASALMSMRQALESAVHQANHDSLTGLANRASVLRQLDEELRRIRVVGGDLAVLFIDVDRFKPINDALGHQFGDAVLRTIARRLEGSVRLEDMVGRLSGDEFVVVCPGLDQASAVERAFELQRVVHMPIRGLGRVQQISVSIGVASALPADRPEGLVANADIAMYRSKEQGRGRVIVFDEQFRDLVRERKFLSDELATAIPNGEMRLVFQPSFGLVTGEMGTSEALVRWQSPKRGLVMPDTFISLAEDSGMVRAIDMWVLEEACRHLIGWPYEPRSLPQVAVNVSARQFTDANFVAKVAEVLERTAAPPDRVWIELTERVLIEDTGQTQRTLSALDSLGIRIALDDFGVGYSSLAYLHRFPLHRVKIDRSFVSALETEPKVDALVQAMLHMAAALGLSVVAEGVETEAHIARLLELDEGRLGARLYGQGFLLGRPSPADELHERVVPTVRGL